MPLKHYAALARVSSREQEREGFSLEVQEQALTRYAQQHAGKITHFVKVAETATKKDRRAAFKELLGYVKKHAAQLDGVLFFKVDRAARNLFDYVELERLEADYHVEVIYVSQPTENTPAGRMMRRTLANMAAFYTEQQSLDVRDGQARRVASGLFVGKAPYGYVNRRREGRGLIDVHPLHGPKIPRIFSTFDQQPHTLDSLSEALIKQGLYYTDAQPRFARSKLHLMLRDRAYLGEVSFHGQWYPGGHPPLVDRPTFERVQLRLGGQVYRAHELTFASELIHCEHCGHPITGERKTKPTKDGPRDYVYYRCARYTAPGHPRLRVNETDLERQTLALFDRLKIPDPRISEWFLRTLRACTRSRQQDASARLAELQRQLTALQRQQERLLNLRLADEIDEATFAAKNTEFRDRVARLETELATCHEGNEENGLLAEKVFELSQTLRAKWVTADSSMKRQLLETVCLNCRLDGVTLVPTMRKPFAVLAEGLPVSSTRGDWI